MAWLYPSGFTQSFRSSVTNMITLGREAGLLLQLPDSNGYITHPINTIVKPVKKDVRKRFITFYM